MSSRSDFYRSGCFGFLVGRAIHRRDRVIAAAGREQASSPAGGVLARSKPFHLRYTWVSLMEVIRWSAKL